MPLPQILRFTIVSCCLLPGVVFAQASPFMTGATALQTNILAWLTPVAIILVMVLGGDGDGKPTHLGLVLGRDSWDRHRVSARRRS